MSMKDEPFFPGWWKYAITGFATGLVAHILFAVLGGCAPLPTPSAEPRYPEYDKWWTQSANTNSLEGLGQGDVYVHEYVTTNLVLGADGLRREIVTNRTEAVLL